MRKTLLSLAAAGAALAAASPAAAQYYPQSSGYGYNGNGYGGYGYNGYGYNNYGGVRSLQARIDAVQWQINRLDRYNRIRDGAADRLREESRNIEHRLRQAGRYGLNPYEANDIQARIARLEQRVQYAAADRYGRYGYNGYQGDRDDRRDYDRDD
jgi:opacity protein-like surface antigen